MKKLLLILLMLVLPLQMTWAAASAYCQHEDGKAAHHFGHHGHEHKTKAEAEKKPAKGQPHSDCHFCHGYSHASPGDQAMLDVLDPGSARGEPPSLIYASHIPDGPKRPNWLPLAV